jgi:hypothetical protein
VPNQAAVKTTTLSTDQKNHLNQYVTKPHPEIPREIASISTGTFGIYGPARLCNKSDELGESGCVHISGLMQAWLFARRASMESASLHLNTKSALYLPVQKAGS